MYRRRILSGLLLGLSVVLLALSLEPRAYAYVDPGSSLLLFQGIGATLSAGLFYFRKRLMRLFGTSRATEERPVEKGFVAVKKAD